MARKISEWWLCFCNIFSLFSIFPVGWLYKTKVTFASYLGCQHSFISRSPILPKLIRFSCHHQVSSEQKIIFSSQLVFLCNVLNCCLHFSYKEKNSHICSTNHWFPGASRLGKCRDQCWTGLNVDNTFFFLHCSHVYCFPEWQKTRTCAAEFDAPLDWGDVIGGHTVVGLKIQGRGVWLKFCSFIYVVVVIKCCLFFFLFVCLFVCSTMITIPIAAAPSCTAGTQ